MILRLGALRFRVERLPPPVAVRVRWGGDGQAYPVTLPAIMAHSFRGFSDLAAVLGGTHHPRRRRPDYLRRHL